MIKSFYCKETQRIFKREPSSKFPSSIQRSAARKLLMIDAATSLRDLRTPPSNHLEKLRGKRKRQYSIRINDQWRICFEWKQGNAYKTEIFDYH